MPWSRSVYKLLKHIFRKFGIFVSRYREEFVYVDRSKFRDSVFPLLSIEDNRHFYELAKEVVEDSRTLLRFERLFVLYQAISNVVDLEGSAIEVGSYKGGSAYFIAMVFKQLRENKALPVIHIVDTFKGHPKESINNKVDTYHHAGMFSDTSFKGVQNYLKDFKNIIIHPSSFSQCKSEMEADRFCFAHVDVDTYLGTKECLEFLLPRMVNKGVIVVDDYGASKCPGVKEAVDRIVKDKSYVRTWIMQTEQVVIEVLRCKKDSYL